MIRIRWVRWLGSIRMAVPLLIVIASVLAWGTLYETRFGTSSVQRFVYRAWWFQALLGFLAVNLAMAAWQRYPWKRTHLPFVLAHVGIILILVGGIIGGRFGVEGQLIIPEGQAERTLQLPGNVLMVHRSNPGTHLIIPTRFETQAWVHEPHWQMSIQVADRTMQLAVDRYYPDAVVDEKIEPDEAGTSPAAHVLLVHGEQQEAMWLLADDPQRFGLGWGEAHVLFFAPETKAQREQLLGRAKLSAPPRGVLAITVPGLSQPREIPVPAERDAEVPIEGTPYRLTFKDYFPDFAMTEQGLVSRSNQPNNPAVSFVLSGPEGSDAHLAFALHPDFSSMHSFQHVIPAQIRYTHSASSGRAPSGARHFLASEDRAGSVALPPNCIALVHSSEEGLTAVFTGDGGTVLDVIDSVAVGQRYTHPSLGYDVEVATYYPKAGLKQEVRNRSDDVRAEAVHVVLHDGDNTQDGWIGLRQSTPFAVGDETVTLSYQPGQRELPVTIKLLDFRKIDYPGTSMAASFEADVQLTDPERGVILMRTIKMNTPLKYRGYSFFQSSFLPAPQSEAERQAGIPGETETTVLSVRNDPGTPLVYAGFLIVIAGVVSLFVMRAQAGKPARPSRRRRTKAS